MVDMQTKRRTKLIGAAEAATLLDRDRSTINRWALRGKLPTAGKVEAVTGARLFRLADVERLKRELDDAA